MRRCPWPCYGRARGSFLGCFALGCALSAHLTIAPVPGNAQGLESADAAYEASRLVPAERAYEIALRSGELGRPELVRAHLRLGVLAILAAEDDRAARHFALALALEPDAAAPPELDASGLEAFEAIRRSGRGARLRAVIETSDATEPVRIDVRGAPLHAVRTVELVGRGGFVHRVSWTGEPVALSVPRQAHPLGVRALDGDGNVLATAGVVRLEAADSVRANPAPTAPPAEVESSPDLIESPWLWIVVGVVVAGVAVAVGVSASGERFVLDAPVVR